MSTSSGQEGIIQSGVIPLESANTEYAASDPGAMVSDWYRLKAAHDNTIKSLEDAEKRLNAIAATLQENYGIIVPRLSGVSRSRPVSEIPQPSVVVEPYAPVDESYGDDMPMPADAIPWVPPTPVPIMMAPVTSLMVDRIRQDADMGATESGFAGMVSNLFEAATRGLK